MLREPRLPEEVRGTGLFQRQHNLVTRVNSLLLEEQNLLARLPVIRRELSEIAARSSQEREVVEALERLYKARPGKAPAPPPELPSKKRKTESLVPLPVEEARELGGEELAEAVQALRAKSQEPEAPAAPSKSAKRRAKLLEKLASKPAAQGPQPGKPEDQKPGELPKEASPKA